MRSLAGEGVRVPSYLSDTYWWAYVHPRAVRLFERKWLVSLILWGNFARLGDAALDALGGMHGRTLQVACVYGDLTERLSRKANDSDGSLDVVDVLPIQLDNLARKLPHDRRVQLHLADSSRLGFADGAYDRALLFFLLHEQPEDVRRRTLAEALRVVKPGGRLVIVDYHRPSLWNPLFAPMAAILKALEPFAMDLWRRELVEWLPAGAATASPSKRTLFGGLYQLMVIDKA